MGDVRKSKKAMQMKPLQALPDRGIAATLWPTQPLAEHSENCKESKPQHDPSMYQQHINQRQANTRRMLMVCDHCVTQPNACHILSETTSCVIQCYFCCYMSHTHTHIKRKNQPTQEAERRLQATPKLALHCILLQAYWQMQGGLPAP
jgi:hypothetical protein